MIALEGANEQSEQSLTRRTHLLPLREEREERRTSVNEEEEEEEEKLSIDPSLFIRNDTGYF